MVIEKPYKPVKQDKIILKIINIQKVPHSPAMNFRNNKGVSQGKF